VLTRKFTQHTISETVWQSADEAEMQFGERVRELRLANQLTQRELAGRLGVSFTYISKVENEKLHFGDYPSEKFIHKLAAELEADESELLLLADKVPADIRQRIREKPEAFRMLASVDDRTLDQVMQVIKRKKATQ